MKKFRRMGLQEEKKTDSNRTRQKNKRGDNKVESNDSPEILDRGETSDIPSLLLGYRNDDHFHLCSSPLSQQRQ